MITNFLFRDGQEANSKTKQITIHIEAELPAKDCTAQHQYDLLNEIHKRISIASSPLINARELTVTAKP